MEHIVDAKLVKWYNRQTKRHSKRKSAIYKYVVDGKEYTRMKYIYTGDIEKTRTFYYLDDPAKVYDVNENYFADTLYTIATQILPIFIAFIGIYFLFLLCGNIS